MSARWYKRCGADFIHGTMQLTLEEKGAYSLCLDLIYDRGGPIPDDARWLSGVCGVSIRKWNAIRARLLELGKLSAGHSMLSNARADLELVSAALSARERAESGAKGGRQRAENADQQRKNNDLGQAEPKREEKIREDKRKVDPDGSTARARDGYHRLPEGWRPTRPLPANTQAKVDQWPPGALEAELAAFHRWAANASNDKGKGRKLDWDKAWVNWIERRDDERYSRQRNGVGRDQPANDGLGPTARSAIAAFPDVFGPEAGHAGGVGH